MYAAPMQQALTTPVAGGAEAAAAAEGAAGAESAEGALGSGVAGDLGGIAALGSGVAGDFGGIADSGALAGLGEAASVGGLSVPPSWGWAAGSPTAPMLGSVPLALPDLNLGATGGLPLAAGLPLMAGGIPRAAAAGAGGTAAGKYGPRLAVVARSPAAGYPPAPESPAAQAYPVPAGFPTNGHAPPGYTPAIVYLPTNGNGHAPATV